MYTRCRAELPFIPRSHLHSCLLKGNGTAASHPVRIFLSLQGAAASTSRTLESFSIEETLFIYDLPPENTFCPLIVALAVLH